MAAVLGRMEVGVREFGSSVRIPDHPKAKMMYYFDCICAVLDLSDQDNLSRLRDYTNFFCLTESETDELFALVLVLSPDELNGKIFFQDDDMCGDSNNAFFELSAVQHNLLLTDTILIGGQRRSVKKIMAYKRQWVLNFWVDPVRQLAARARIRSMLPSPTPAIEDRPYDYNTFNNSHYYSNSRSSDTDSCCCTII